MFTLLVEERHPKVNIIHYEMRFKDYLRLIKNETSLEDFRNKARTVPEQGVALCFCCFLRETFIKWKGNDGITTVEMETKLLGNYCVHLLGVFLYFTLPNIPKIFVL